MLKEQKRLEKEIIAIEKQLKQLPEGKLVICFDGKKHYKWFRSTGSGQTYKKEYLERHQRPEAEQLAYKNVLNLQLEELRKKKEAADYYIQHYPKEISKASQKISESSEYQKLLSSYFLPLEQELNNWMNEPYEKKNDYQNNLKHTTITGEKVRSKSEELIYTYLKMSHIPFRYECALKLGRKTIYPDFTIRHPKTGEFYYYEHFGLMDNREYAKKAFAKLELYQEYGISLASNLIVTFEDKEHPLTTEKIRKEIDYYLL